jgi:hypothetical protein
MERAVHVFVLVNLLVIGLSHVLAPVAWARFFGWLRGKGEAGVFIVAGMSLSFGSIIVAFHNVWHGLPLVVTLLGWAQVLKGAIYYCFPAFGLKQLARVREDNARILVAPGAVFFGLALLLAWGLWRD